MKAAQRALELGKFSTWVNGWYPHRYSSDPDCAATVRGPFCRWLKITQGGGWDEKKGRPNYVADPGDDADFIAFALNNIESIATNYLLLLEAVRADELGEVESVATLQFDKGILEKDNKELFHRNGEYFSNSIRLHDVIEKLKEESEANFKAADSWKVEALRQQEIGDDERWKVEEKLSSAIKTINEMQTRLSGFTTNSSDSFAPLKDAFNIGARFLSEHPWHQGEYLNSVNPIKPLGG